MDLFSRTANIGEGEGREAIIGRSGVLWGEWREGKKFLRFKFWFFSSKCAVDVTKTKPPKQQKLQKTNRPKPFLIIFKLSTLKRVKSALCEFSIAQNYFTKYLTDRKRITLEKKDLKIKRKFCIFLVLYARKAILQLMTNNKRTRETRRSYEYFSFFRNALRDKFSTADPQAVKCAKIVAKIVKR